MDDIKWKKEAKRLLGDKYSKAIVYTGGTFDILHLGHINIFKKAKEIGKYLIVAVSTDELVRSYKSDYPILTYEERRAVVESVRCVDEVVKQTRIFDVNQFKEIGADIFIIGDDWKKREPVPEGLKWLKEHDKALFVPYTKGLSSTEIKNRILARKE